MFLADLRNALTISSLFYPVSYTIRDAYIKPVVHIIRFLVADLAPLQNNLDSQVYMHSEDTKPEGPSEISAADSKQSDAERRLRHHLANHGATGRDLYQNLHPVVPAFRKISSLILNGNEKVVHEEDKL